MNGFLIVDKPAGMTSHDCVSVCRKRLQTKRIGHAGTLDPDATGVLVLGVGRGTRLLPFLASEEKEYETTAKFGVETTSQDASGEIVSETDASDLGEESLEKSLEEFRGDIMQVPPMVSAVKVGGERLYKKARRGESVAREARRVTITRLVCAEFQNGRHPTAKLTVTCSKGTYIRTLIHDIGARLGVGAHITALRRTRSGAFTLNDAIALDDVDPERVRPMEHAVASFPARVASESEVRAIVQGKPLPAAGFAGPYAIVGPSGLVAMAEDRGDECRSLCVVADQ